jgi:glycopeptide antibiotics resistance protein
VLLPLPGPGTRRLVQTVQLMPFQWVTDIGTELHKHGLPMWAVLQTRTLQQVGMNVLLFVPLGVFAFLLWQRSLGGAVLMGFAVSLLIEVTQLTANFGTAPFVYRVFDVDDLITNTVGAAIGYLVAKAITRTRVVAHSEPVAKDHLRDLSPARDHVTLG